MDENEFDEDLFGDFLEEKPSEPDDFLEEEFEKVENTLEEPEEKPRKKPAAKKSQKEPEISDESTEPESENPPVKTPVAKKKPSSKDEFSGEFSRDSLIEATSWVSKLAASDTQFSLLFRNNIVTLFGESSTSFLQYPLEGLHCSGTLEASIPVEFVRSLGQVLKHADDDTVRLTADKNGVFFNLSDRELHCERFVTQVNIPESAKTLGTVSQGEFFTALKIISTFVEASSLAMPVFQGIHIRESKGKLTVMASDNTIFGEMTIPMDGEDWTKPYLITKDLASAGSTSETDFVDIVLQEDTQRFGVRFNDGRLCLFAMIQADPIDFHASLQQALKEEKHSLTVGVKQFGQAVSDIQLIDPYHGATVKLKLPKSGTTHMVISGMKSGSQIKAPVQDSTADKAVDITFNGGELLKCLSGVLSENIRMEFTDGVHSVFVKRLLSDGEPDEDSLFVIAPLT